MTEMTRPMNARACRLAAAAACIALAGCGVGARMGKQVDDTWAGDMLFKNGDKVVLTTDGGNDLNPDAQGKPLSVVVRIYQLTTLDRFASVDADSLWDAPSKALGNTLLDSQELVLLPGMGQVNRWPLLSAANYVGIAAFFRDSHDSHWKSAFTANAWRKDGLWFSTKGSRVLIDNNHILAVGGGDLLTPDTTPAQIAATHTEPPSTAQTLQASALKTAEDTGSDQAKQQISNTLESKMGSVHE